MIVRLPLPDALALTEAQQDAVGRVTGGPRGEISGPFVPLLRSPELMTRLQLVGEYIRFDSKLDDDLVELVILTVARHWDQQFEWGFHNPIALQKGLTREAIEQVGSRTRPTAGRLAVALVWDLVWDLVEELQLTRTVSDEVDADAIEGLGESRVVEVVGTLGYYTTLAMTMNMARTPPPERAPRLQVEQGQSA